MPIPPLLSLCIPTYRRLRWLRACLQEVLSQAEALPAGLVEVVVCENCGDDGSWEFLQEEAARHPCLKIRRNEANVGAANFDRVVQAASGRYAWMMGDDDAPLPGGVARLVEILRETPRDLYLMHSLEVDLEGRPITRREWFQNLPTLDWDLSDPAALKTYLDHTQLMGGAFGFLSVLVVDREAWMQPVEGIETFRALGWPHVGRALSMVRTRGRLRVLEDTLVRNTAGNDPLQESDPFGRALWDLKGWVSLGRALFRDQPAMREAFHGILRRNREPYLIQSLTKHAPNFEAWVEARSLMIEAGIPSLAIETFGLALRLQDFTRPLCPRLDDDSILVTDMGFLTRGARRVLVLMPGDLDMILDAAPLLAALQDQTRARIRILASPGYRRLLEAFEVQEFDLGEITRDAEKRNILAAELVALRPDLILNLERDRNPALDLLVIAAHPIGAVCFRAPADRTEVATQAWLDRHYSWPREHGSAESLLPHLGLEPAGPRLWPAREAREEAQSVWAELGWEPVRTLALLGDELDEEGPRQEALAAIPGRIAEGWKVLGLGGPGTQKPLAQVLDSFGDAAVNLGEAFPLPVMAALLRDCGETFGGSELFRTFAQASRG